MSNDDRSAQNNAFLDLERMSAPAALEYIRCRISDPATREVLLALARAQLRTMGRI